MKPVHDNLLFAAESRFLKIRTDLYTRFMAFKRDVELEILCKYQDAERKSIKDLYDLDMIKLDKQFKGELEQLKISLKNSIRKNKVIIKQ